MKFPVGEAIFSFPLTKLHYCSRSCEPSPVFNRVSNQRGGVPVNNITSSQSPTTAPASMKARVLYDYDAADTTELSLLADEVRFLCFPMNLLEKLQVDNATLSSLLLEVDGLCLKLSLH